MVKHIIIAGVPRAGKSTVAAMVAQRYGYQHISMDAIIAGFEACFPETEMVTCPHLPRGQVLHTISRKMAPFLQAMIESGEYDEVGYGMAVDIYQLLSEDYIKHIDPAVCAIAYFITAETTVEERFHLLKQFDTPKDYTFFESDERNIATCQEIVSHSQLIREQCQRFGLPCYETSRNRAQVLQGFVDSLAIAAGC